MAYKLRFAKRAAETLQALEHGGPNELAKLKKVRRALRHLEENPRHPGLHSHLYESFPVDRGVKVWDSYVENKTPGAWRIFWQYGPEDPEGSDELDSGVPVITVLAISPHP